MCSAGIDVIKSVVSRKFPGTSQIYHETSGDSYPNLRSPVLAKHLAVLMLPSEPLDFNNASLEKFDQS